MLRLSVNKVTTLRNSRKEADRMSFWRLWIVSCMEFCVMFAVVECTFRIAEHTFTDAEYKLCRDKIASVPPAARISTRRHLLCMLSP